jgi:hypothetical protein
MRSSIDQRYRWPRALLPLMIFLARTDHKAGQVRLPRRSAPERVAAQRFSIVAVLVDHALEHRGLTIHPLRMLLGEAIGAA